MVKYRALIVLLTIALSSAVLPAGAATSSRASRLSTANSSEIKIPIKPGVTVTEIDGKVKSGSSVVGFPFTLTVGNAATIPVPTPYAALVVEVTKTHYEIFVVINKPKSGSHVAALAPRVSHLEAGDDILNLIIRGGSGHDIFWDDHGDGCSIIKQAQAHNLDEEYVHIAPAIYDTPPIEIVDTGINECI